MVFPNSFSIGGCDASDVVVQIVPPPWPRSYSLRWTLPTSPPDSPVDVHAWILIFNMFSVDGLLITRMLLIQMSSLEINDALLI
jgi:hypothetical protein